MEPKIVSRPAFTVAGMALRSTGQEGEFGQLWQRFMPRMHEIQQVVDPATSYGVMYNYDEATGRFDYLAGFEVASGAALPEGMTSADIPAQTYAIFTCTLPTIGQAYQHIYGTWLPQSGYQHAPSPEFELYGADFNPNDPASEMQIYIPIGKS